MRLSLLNWILLCFAVSGLLGVVVIRRECNKELAASNDEIYEMSLKIKDVKDSRDRYQDWASELDQHRTDDAVILMRILRQRFSEEEIKAQGNLVAYLLKRAKRSENSEPEESRKDRLSKTLYCVNKEDSQ